MKMGIRTPNIKKSVKARTTGKMKRAVKKSVNPLYGKKGMGYVNHPKKAVYNKVYNKTTVDARPASFSSCSKTKSSTPPNNNTQQEIQNNSVSDTAPRKQGSLYLGLGAGFYILLATFVIYFINGSMKYSQMKTKPFNYILMIVLFLLGNFFTRIYKSKNK